MRLFVSLLVIGLLSACAPSIETASEDQVSINYHNYSDSPTTLQPMANEHCASFNRTAFYQRTTSGEGLVTTLTGLPLYAQFECRPPLFPE